MAKVVPRKRSSSLSYKNRSSRSSSKSNWSNLMIASLFFTVLTIALAGSAIGGLVASTTSGNVGGAIVSAVAAIPLMFASFVTGIIGIIICLVGFYQTRNWIYGVQLLILLAFLITLIVYGQTPR